MSSTISQLLRIAAEKIDRLDAELLLAHILKQKREFIIAHPEYTAGKIKNWKFKTLVTKRAKGTSTAHLIGHKEFCGLDFIVTKHTLIPRPETEVLVEEAIKECKNENTLIDIGTGSGCIPISIIKLLQMKIDVYATDISRTALKIAKKNAHKHSVNIHFSKGNLLEPINSQINKTNNLIITANLPYLTQKQFDSETSIQHEPLSALVAKDSGLELYKKLLGQIAQLTNPSIICFFEIDPSQAKVLSKYIYTMFPNSKIEVIKDGMGNDRIIKTILIVDKP